MSVAEAAGLVAEDAVLVVGDAAAVGAGGGVLAELEVGGGVVAALGAAAAEAAGAVEAAGAAEAGDAAAGVEALLASVPDVTVEAADVTAEVADVISEVSVVVTGEPAEPGVVAASGAVDACACRANTSRTTRIPAASIANCVARRATRRNIGCGIRGSPHRRLAADSTAHL